MNVIELRKIKVFNKYHDSDIFNTRTETNLKKTYRPKKYKTTQPSLEKTKSDIFNTENKSINPYKTKTMKKRQINLKNYRSDIFNLKKDIKNRQKSCKRMNVNFSTCFDGIKNDEEYIKDLNKYTLKHRPKQKKYEVEKYFNKESAINRYYKELYGDEKSGVFPEKIKLNKTTRNSPSKNIINTFKNNMKIFENRKKNLKRQLTEMNDVGADGKKIPGEHLGQTIDSKGNIIKYNKRKIDLYGESLDNRNNKKIIKEKNVLAFNSKMNKQLEFQSNIFNEENKDIDKKIYDFIYNKKEEKERKKKLQEKVKKEREDMAKKLKELKEKNINKDNTKLPPSTMKWSDPETQIYFKKGDSNNNQDETSAFHRKIKDLSDSNNIDIFSKNKKSFNIKKLKKTRINNNNDNNVHKIREILNNISDNSLREDQKLGIINKSTTSNFLNSNSKNDEKLQKYYNTINNNIKSARLSKSKKKENKIIKIMGKNSKNNNKPTGNNKEKNQYKVHNYTLVYSTKNKFDKLENSEIKKIFIEKGIHAYDVNKNELSIGNLNSVKFKIRESDENNEKEIEQKMKLIEDELNKNKFKVKINKEKIIKLTKNNRDLKEKERTYKTPYKSKGKKSIISQFPKVNLKYKNTQKQ